LAATVLALGGSAATLAVASAPSRSAAHAPAGHGLTIRFPFTQTNPGHQHGATITGVEGHGTFSATLGAHASAAALLALATGIPFTKIARGGSYAAKFTIGASGTNTGTVVARFKAAGLGSLCFAFTAKGGHYQVGDSFIPTTGTIKVLGGTGAAARWSAAASYSLKAITGTKTPKYTFSGSAHGKIAKKRGLSSTCKQVAALIHG
jgi:hypothetical protein